MMRINTDKNLVLFVTIFLFIGINSVAQSKDSNLEKYWDYRSTLVNEFVVIGDDQGESLPASRRDSANQLLKWADQTISLGWYIGVLATEHYMLTSPLYKDFAIDSANALNQNVQELYYALTALKRLDVTAENYFVPPCQPVDSTHNGFLLRDDVYEGFEANFDGIDTIISDYTIAGPEVNEMSQDQAYHLMLGLTLVSKLVPDTLKCKGVKLQRLAVDQAARIAHWLGKSQWTIRNPSCSNREVARGSDAYFFGQGINLAIQFITNGNVSLANKVNLTQETIWAGLSLPSHPAYQNKDNLHMAMCLGAIGDGWEASTFYSLMNLSNQHNYYLYPLLAAALHNTSDYMNYSELSIDLQQKADMMLNNAPDTGIYCPLPDTNGHGWNSSRRFTASISQQKYGNTLHTGNKYTGIDYQLLHNLFYISFPKKWDSTLTNVQNKEQEKVKFDIVPNPTRGAFEIHRHGRVLHKAKIQVIDINGQVKIKQYIPANTTQKYIRIPQISTGVYLIRIKDINTGQSDVTKLVIIK